MISILIPLYNAAPFVGRTVENCLGQSCKDIEVVIVDDHSTDNSLQIARRYESDRVRVLQNPHKGGNSARNHAFRESHGEYVKFLDADDYCSERMLERQLARLERDGTPMSVAFSPIRMWHEDTDEWLIPPHEIDHDYEPGINLLLDIWRGKGWRCPHCHLMHRRLVDRAGLWDETIKKNQDGEFFSRIYAAADKALAVPEEYAVWTQQKNGVHTKMSLRAVNSATDALEKIARLILGCRDDEETRGMCNRYFGGFLYENYAKNPDMLSHFEYVARQLGLKPALPQRKALKLLGSVMGWKMALRVMYRFNI